LAVLCSAFFLTRRGETNKQTNKRKKSKSKLLNQPLGSNFKARKGQLRLTLKKAKSGHWDHLKAADASAAAAKVPAVDKDADPQGDFFFITFSALFFTHFF
jgi:hypothetical protein